MLLLFILFCPIGVVCKIFCQVSPSTVFILSYISHIKSLKYMFLDPSFKPDNNFPPFPSQKPSFFTIYIYIYYSHTHMNAYMLIYILYTPSYYPPPFRDQLAKSPKSKNIIYAKSDPSKFPLQSIHTLPLPQKLRLHNGANKTKTSICATLATWAIGTTAAVVDKRRSAR